MKKLAFFSIKFYIITLTTCLISALLFVITTPAFAGNSNTFPTGPFSSSYTSDAPSTYNTFLSYQDLVKKLQKIAAQSNGQISLQSMNKFINGVCDIGAPCDSSYFDNVNGPYDLRSHLKKDLLLVKIGTGAKKVLFITGQHGNEDGPNTLAALNLLQQLSDQNLVSKIIKSSITLYILVRANPDGAEIIDRGDGLPPHPRRCNSTPFTAATGSPASCHLDSANGVVRLGMDINRFNYPANITATGAPISNASIYQRAPEAFAIIELYRKLRDVPNIYLPASDSNPYRTNLALLSDWHGNFATVTCPLIFDVTLKQFVCKNHVDTDLVTVSPIPDIATVNNILPTVPLNSSTPLKVLDPNIVKTDKQMAIAIAAVMSLDDKVKISKYPFSKVSGISYGFAGSSYAYEGTPTMGFEILFNRHDYNDNLGDSGLAATTTIVNKTMYSVLLLITTEAYKLVKNPEKTYLDNIPEATGTVGVNLRSPPYTSVSFVENFLGLTTATNNSILPIECICPFNEAFVRDVSLFTFERCKLLQSVNPAPNPSFPAPLPYVSSPAISANCPMPDYPTTPGSNNDAGLD